jgi:hypothetical protein
MQVAYCANDVANVYSTHIRVRFIDEIIEHEDGIHDGHICLPSTVLLALQSQSEMKIDYAYMHEHLQLQL